MQYAAFSHRILKHSYEQFIFRALTKSSAIPCRNEIFVKKELIFIVLLLTTKKSLIIICKLSNQISRKDLQLNTEAASKPPYKHQSKIEDCYLIKMEGYTKTITKFPTEKSVYSAFEISIDGSGDDIVHSNLLLKEINPTFIYEWEGESADNRIEGKGCFRAKDNSTNQLVFWCFSQKWRNQCPVGQVQYGRVILFDKNPGDKVKECHVYQGQVKKLRKNGKGSYKIEEHFRNGEIRTQTMEGVWENDVLLKGTVIDHQGFSRDITLSQNIEWSKSRQDIPEGNHRKEARTKSKKNRDNVGKVNLEIPNMY